MEFVPAGIDDAGVLRATGVTATDRGEGMGLTTRERHALYSIENGIAGSDPRLASMLAMFTRLAASEVLPAGENIRAGRLRSGLRWQYAWGMVWLITSVALIAVALAVGHAGGKGTCPVRAAACAGQFVGHIAW